MARAPKSAELELSSLGALDQVGDIFAGVELPLLEEAPRTPVPTAPTAPQLAQAPAKAAPVEYEVPGLDDDAGSRAGPKATLDDTAQYLKALSPESLMALAVGDKEQVAAIEEQLKTAHRLSNKVSALMAHTELRRRVSEGKVPTDVLLNIYKAFTTEGALTPKDDKGAGGAFSLTIVGLSQPVQVQATQVVENDG